MQALYGHESVAPVSDFLADPIGTSRETLLCRQFPNGDFEVALCLAPEPIARLVQSDPFVRLDAQNFADFCVATEGVSHFVNVALAHAKDHTCSILELEWQAEVDKFCLALLLLSQQRPSHAALPHALFMHLFVHFSLQGEIARVHQHRYYVANRGAARICRQWLDEGLERHPTLLIDRWRQTRSWEKGRKLGAAT